MLKKSRVTPLHLMVDKVLVHTNMRSLHLWRKLLNSFHYKFITEKLLLVDDR